MKKKVVIYLKDSSTRKKEEGQVITNQKEKIIQFCKATNHDVVEIFEEDSSALDLVNRTKYQELKNFLQNNKDTINKVIVLRWHRISRNHNEVLKEINWFKKFDVEVNAVEQWIDWDTPESKILMKLYNITPEVESDNTPTTA